MRVSVGISLNAAGRLVEVRLASDGESGTLDKISVDASGDWPARFRAWFDGGNGLADGVDLSGLSDWQRRVLAALAEIPRGRVTSYGALARRIGRAGAARAVGHACAANPLPLVFPCHRVVNSDRTTGFYMRAPRHALKRALLEREGVCFEASGRVAKECFLD